MNFEKYCFESRLVEAIERAMDPYIGIKQDRDDDELEEDEIRTIGVFVNDSESFIKKYIKHFQKVGRNHIKERFQDFGITCAAGSQWTWTV